MSILKEKVEKKHVSVMLESELNEKLDKYKDKYGFTKSYIINDLLNKYLKEEYGNHE